MARKVLELFHPLIRDWFARRYGEPTEIQRRAWPEIARGRHVLVCAPTGTGKTLAAFLWALNRLAVRGAGNEGADAGGAGGRVLYVSPLKALNSDIHRNLERPLAEMRAAFAAAGEPFPRIRVAVRSGDTDPAERRRTARHPPEIFITTPESLNILLASRSGRVSLTGFSTVILDEIHAVVPAKRGTFLMTAVERLVPLCGEFQRIALSATVAPMEEVAAFVGGRRLGKDAGGEAVYRQRPVTLAASREPVRCGLEVRVAQGAGGGSADPGARWAAVGAEFRGIVDRNRSTLFFVNSRRMSEKVARLINEQGPGDPAYAHHGSLSREIRTEVESRLKEGALSAVVATGSLELGIDIGTVDEVVLVEAPVSVSSAVQRIGRSGHAVGERSRGTFCPLHDRGLLEAAVLAARVEARDIEPVHPLNSPLDVLAQVVVSMTAHQTRDLDEVYRELRASWPYRGLDRRAFDLVVEMLAGRYRDDRVRELRPRLAVDRLRNTATARDHAAPLLYLSGGVIPDRGYFQLRVAGSGARIGELDEEFVWERSVGDAFPLGSQLWQIRRITHNDVEVAPAAGGGPRVVPFWKGEALDRPFHFAEAVGRFLEEAQESLETPAFRAGLLSRHHMTEPAADRLMGFLRRQRAFTGAPLPHRRHLLVEHILDPASTEGCRRTVLHTLWGGRVNRPLALALAAAWEQAQGAPLESYADNDCVLIAPACGSSPGRWRDLLTPENLVRLLRSRLESTAFFGARFRENAQRALLLPRRGFRERMPLWLNRLRAKKLLQAVSRYEDFPVLIETWRECLEDAFDLPALCGLLEELGDGRIRVTEVETRGPSPFAEGVAWFQTHQLMYQDDSPPPALRSALSDGLLLDLAHGGRFRPGVSRRAAERFREKRQRVAPGYAPAGADELVEWVKERRFIPHGEWRELLASIRRDHGTDPETLERLVRDRVRTLRLGGGAHGVAALEDLGRVERALAAPGPVEAGASAGGGTERLGRFLAEWLRFYGPVTRDFVRGSLGADERALDLALDRLVQDRALVEDRLREDAPGGGTGPAELCDAENLDALLRMQRLDRRPVFSALPANALQLFQASHQGLSPPAEDLEGLQARLEQLFGYPAAARLWETDILPSRLSRYAPAQLDTVLQESGLLCLGAGRERLFFCFETDLELFRPVAGVTPCGGRSAAPPVGGEAVAALLGQSRGRMSFLDLAAAAGKESSTEGLATGLWQLFWQGRVACDSFSAVRGGIRNRFRTEAHRAPVRGRGAGARSGFGRWKGSRPFAGNWMPLPGNRGGPAGPLARHELSLERARVLLGRYGVVFRERLWSEGPGFRWGDVFRSLRILELGGEALSGQFFEGVPGLQFCSPDALRLLKRPLPEDAVYWMNAADPASLCGIPLEGLRPALPGTSRQRGELRRVPVDLDPIAAAVRARCAVPQP